jgi:two-component system, OmpR family, response regulator
MPKKVLFINRVNPASIIPELLTSAGYEAAAVDEAGAGLSHLASNQYDMVILAEQAAAESWIFCKEIRRRTASPIIVISSGASTEACVRAINAGADFFIRKPFGPMELIARVNALFQRATTSQPVPMVP